LNWQNCGDMFDITNELMAAYSNLLISSDVDGLQGRPRRCGSNEPRMQGMLASYATVSLCAL
jgi:hypothetical protein